MSKLQLVEGGVGGEGGNLKYGQPIYGDTAVQIAQTLWYADVVLALLVAWAVPFAMYRHQEHALQQMTAVWLLPIVACEVAAQQWWFITGAFGS